MPITSSFDDGATFGLEAYCVKRQEVKTFDAPSLTGYLSACASGGEWFAGVLHGLALGARLQDRQQDLALRLSVAS